MSNLMIILIALGVAILTFFLGWFISRRIGEIKLGKAEELSKKIIQEAEKEAEIKKKEEGDG